MNLDNENVHEEVKRQVKALLVGKGYTFEKLANELKDKYGTADSKNGLCNKLARGTLRYYEFLRILDVLGYTIDVK